MLATLLLQCLALAALLTLAVTLLDRSGTSSLAERFRTLGFTLLTDTGELAPAPTSAELRTRCMEIADNLRTHDAIPENSRSDTWGAQRRGLLDDLHDSDLQATVTENSERHAMQVTAWEHAIAEAKRRAADPNNRDGRGPDAATGAAGQTVESWGQRFTESDNYRNRGGSGTVGEVEVRNLLTGSSIGGTGSDAFVPVGSPFLNPQAVRRMHFFLRDLIPFGPTNLESIPYIQELSPATNETGATTVQEASAKPEVTMQFVRVDAPVRKIAAWIQLTEEAYNDAPTLRGYIDTRLAYMLQVREEAQYLSGNGTSPNLTGITATSGVQTQNAVSGDMPATIGQAIGKIEAVDGMADGAAVNPTTYWSQITSRHSTWLDGGFGGGNEGLPFGSAPPGMWGLPLVRSRVLGSGKALVGCFSIGSQGFDRMQTTIKSTDSHASLFVSNTIVVLAEKRVALAIHRPDFFVDTSIS